VSTGQGASRIPANHLENQLTCSTNEPIAATKRPFCVRDFVTSLELAGRMALDPSPDTTMARYTFSPILWRRIFRGVKGDVNAEGAYSWLSSSPWSF
jgi:hypothetical protein